MKILFIGFFMTLISCNNTTDQLTEKSAQIIRPSYDVFLYWKNDSVGCSGQKNMLNTKLIIKYLDSINNEVEINIIDSLGNPDFKYIDNGFIKYRYYLKDSCDNLSNKDIDRCYLEIAQNINIYKCSKICQ